MSIAVCYDARATLFRSEAHRIQAEREIGMVVFEYVIWISPSLLGLLLLLLIGPVSMLRLPAFQRGRAWRTKLLVWSGVLGLLALVMIFNLTQIWPRIPTVLAVVGQLGWTVNGATTLVLLVTDIILVVTAVRRWNRRQHQAGGV